MLAVKPFVGIMSKEEPLFDKVKERLEEFLGPTDAESPLWTWEHTFHPFPYTYPDFKTKEYIELFNKIRRGLGKQRLQARDFPSLIIRT